MPLDGPRRWPWLKASGSTWAPCASIARTTWPPCSRADHRRRPGPQPAQQGDRGDDSSVRATPGSVSRALSNPQPLRPQPPWAPPGGTWPGEVGALSRSRVVRTGGSEMVIDGGCRWVSDAGAASVPGSSGGFRESTEPRQPVGEPEPVSRVRFHKSRSPKWALAGRAPQAVPRYSVSLVIDIGGHR